MFREDGILIEKVGPTRTIEAMWTTLVVIDPPKEVPMQAWIDQIRRGIQSVGSRVSEQDQQTWQARLDALDLQQPVVGANHSRSFRSLPKRRRRIRRGLLNLVGEVSKTLFGTASESDIRELRTALNKVSDGTAVLVHDHMRMLTVMNKTRKYVQENRFDIKDLQRHQKALDRQIMNFCDDVTQLSYRVSKLSLARSIDRVIEELTVVHNFYSAQMNTFRTQRYELERGWLTENTLSLSDLNETLATIRKWGYETPNAEWYYENLRIEPLWTENGKLVFRVLLPAVSRTQYLHYKIRYYPVVIDSDHIRVVKGHNDVVINTATGAVFWPKDCYGLNPRVCMPQKEILVPTCEWGLITNNSLDRCIIKISKRLNEDSDVFPLGIGTFVIITYKKLEVTLRCSGKAAMVKTMEGPHRIEVPGNCKLETAQWQVSGSRKGSSVQVRKGRTVVYNRSMKFVLPSKMKKGVRQALQFKRRVEIPLLDIRAWQKESSAPWRYDWGSSGKIPGAILALVLVMAIVAAVIIARKRYTKIKPSVGAKVTHSDRVHCKLEGLSDAELASLAV